MAASTQKTGITREPVSQPPPAEPQPPPSNPNATKTRPLNPNVLRRESAPSVPLEGSFDVYRYLNSERPGSSVSRDPILQQMTVIRYEGELDAVTGFFHGHGKLLSTLGYSYVGGFDRGLMHGQGRIEWSDGVVYEGSFVESVIHGAGKYSWPTGDWYEGEVANCVRHGKGVFSYKAIQATYEGGWDMGRRHGHGVLRYSGGQTGELVEYSGEWESDRRSGQGTMKYGDCGVYVGQWKNDIREGQGSMSWKRQGIVVEEYVGTWVGGIPSGIGRSTYIRPPHSSGTPRQGNLQPTDKGQDVGGSGKDSAINTYAGEYLAGQRHGFGIFVYDDGSRYEGQWVGNHKHGEGKFTTANGVVFVGTFHEGHPVQSMANLKPEMTVASPLPLFIRDVLGPAEVNVQEAILSVQSVVSRNNGVFKRCFQYYGGLDSAVDAAWASVGPRRETATQGTMSLLQFFRFLSDARLLNRHTTMAAVGRLLLSFVDRHSTTNLNAYLTGDGSDTVSPTIAAAQGPVGLKEGSPSEKGSFVSSSVAATQLLPPSIQTTATPIAQGLAPEKESPAKRSSGAVPSDKKSHRTSSTKKEPYNSPWERYRRELHTAQGELNFREFVEAIVRIAAFSYADPLFGGLASQLELVVEEHLVPYTCNASPANPLFPISRAHKATLQPFIPFLLKLFQHCSQLTGLGVATVALPSTKGGVGSPRSVGPSDPNLGSLQSLPLVTVRQLGIFLKDAGVFHPPYSITKFLKLVPYDQHPALTSGIFRRRHVASAQRQTSAIPLQGAMTPNYSDRASTLSIDHERPAPLAEGQEAAYRRKVEGLIRSKGTRQHNVHATLLMEVELTFLEFVERLLAVAVSAYPATMSTSARINAFFTERLMPFAGKVGYLPKPSPAGAQTGGFGSPLIPQPPASFGK